MSLAKSAGNGTSAQPPIRSASPTSSIHSSPSGANPMIAFTFCAGLGQLDSAAEVSIACMSVGRTYRSPTYRDILGMPPEHAAGRRLRREQAPVHRIGLRAGRDSEHDRQRMAALAEDFDRFGPP